MPGGDDYQNRSIFKIIFHDREKRAKFVLYVNLTSIPWYLYKMVNQNMLRTHKGKLALSEKNKGLFGENKNPIYDCTRSNQMPQTDQITEIAPQVRTISE